MRLYLEIVRRAFSRQLTYRAATLAGMATNCFFGILRSYVFMAAYTGRVDARGWTLDDALTYVWVGQALIMPVFMWGWWDIALAIRSGDVVTYLSKPFDFYGYWLSQDAGRAICHTLTRGAPTLMFGLLVFDIALPSSALNALSFAASVVLAVWISFGLRFLLNISAFWLLDYRGPGILLMFATSFFSGLLVPLVFWPDWARTIAEALPFSGIIQVPADVYLGKLADGALLGALVFQLAWALALMLAGRRLTSLAITRVVVQGG